MADVIMWFEGIPQDKLKQKQLKHRGLQRLFSNIHATYSQLVSIIRHFIRYDEKLENEEEDFYPDEVDECINKVAQMLCVNLVKPYIINDPENELINRAYRNLEYKQGIVPEELILRLDDLINAIIY